MTTLTLTDFLLARIAEDEELARHVWPERYTDRMLADSRAKRAIVERADESVAHAGQDIERQWTLSALASIYANHKDFHSDWAL